MIICKVKMNGKYQHSFMSEMIQIMSLGNHVGVGYPTKNSTQVDSRLQKLGFEQVMIELNFNSSKGTC